MRYYIDEIRIADKTITVSGWALPNDPSHSMTVNITDKSGNIHKDGSIILIPRPDVVASLPDKISDNRIGFYAQFRGEGTINIYDEKNPSDCINHSMNLTGAFLRSVKAKLRKNVNAFKAFKASDDKKAAFRQTPFYINRQYAKFYKNNLASAAELKEQRNKEFSYAPLISVIVPVYNPKAAHIKAMIASVKDQTYQSWQLCLANGSPDNAEISEILSENAAKDSRIKVKDLTKNLGISGNTNAALSLAACEWIALMDQDDLIAPGALYEYVKSMNEDPEIDAIYCDEDKLDDKNKKHFDPNFKSDYNIDLLTCNNYICHMFMVRKTVIDTVGAFDPKFDGAQDHDFILRCTDAARKTHHIPKLLYSWRSHRGSTAAEAVTKTYAFDAGVMAIQSYYDRKGIPAKVSAMDYFGWYRTDFTIEKEPMISVIIPNKDHIDDLSRCITSILEKITYQNYEIIVVENNSEEAATFDYYNTLPTLSDKIRVVTWDREFNYSAINNYGATFARGEYLLLLNNDTQVISPDLFTSMMGYCMREDVGAVGPKLLFEDNTIQHAGLLIGVDHAAHHVFLHYRADEMGYLGRAIVSQDLSGVTAACMLIKKKVFDEVGGLDEDFIVAYNDVDLCLKIGAAGYNIVYDAFVRMYHYESKSRGYETSEENKARFEAEKAHLLAKWGTRMDADPYYNANLTSLKNGYYRI